MGIFGGWGKHLTRPGAGQAPRPTTLHARTPGRSSFAAGARASARDEELSHVLVSATLPRSMWRQQHGWRAGGGRRAAFTSPSLCAWRGVHARGRAPAAKPNRARRPNPTDDGRATPRGALASRSASSASASKELHLRPKEWSVTVQGAMSAAKAFRRGSARATPSAPRACHAPPRHSRR